MFNLLKYLKNNNWKTVRADWDEYVLLKKSGQKLKMKLADSFIALLCDAKDCSKNNTQLKCVQNIKTNDPDGTLKYCPYFSKHNETIGCTKQDCKYSEQNRMYSDAAKCYNEWLQAKNNFWNKKMLKHNR